MNIVSITHPLTLMNDDKLKKRFSIERDLNDVVQVYADKVNEKNEVPDVNAEEKEMKQRQMTDFFVMKKSI